MEYDPKYPIIQFQLTKICQVIANPNSRRIIEILASAPLTQGDLTERVDLSPTQINSALGLMIELKLVKPMRVAAGPITYTLADGGLRLVRSWLDRIASISEGTGHSKR
jgi:DNA-binding transcriptional ArsR family regulator